MKISVPLWRPVRVGGGGGGGLWNLKMGVVPCRAAYLGPNALCLRPCLGTEKGPYRAPREVGTGGGRYPGVGACRRTARAALSRAFSTPQDGRAACVTSLSGIRMWPQTPQNEARSPDFEGHWGAPGVKTAQIGPRHGLNTHFSCTPCGPRSPVENSFFCRLCICFGSILAQRTNQIRPNGLHGGQALGPNVHLCGAG